MSVSPPTRRIRPLAVLAAALLLCAWLQTASTQQAGAADAVPAAAVATFTDDFNGTAGTGVDSSKWRPETGDSGISSMNGTTDQSETVTARRRTSAARSATTSTGP